MLSPHQIILLALVILAVGLGFLLLHVWRDMQEEHIRNRKNGCHCKRNILGWYTISPECPVHREECTIHTFKNWYGALCRAYPHISEDRIMLCQSCFDDIARENIALFYYRKVGECSMCNKQLQVCISVPANLVEKWVRDKTFYTGERDDGGPEKDPGATGNQGE